MSIVNFAPAVAKAKYQVSNAAKNLVLKETEKLPQKIECMEDALRLTGYMDKVKFVADSDILMPKTKTMVQMLSEYESKLQK